MFADECVIYDWKSEASCIFSNHLEVPLVEVRGGNSDAILAVILVVILPQNHNQNCATL